MNSTEDLPSNTREPSQYPYYCHPSSTKKTTTYFEYDFTDDRPTKKEKKWSFGNLFRRKKKNNDGASSSDEDAKKVINDKRRKNKERKKPVTFDHVVITQPKVRTAATSNGVLSDNSETVLRYANRVPLNYAPRIEHYTHHWDPNLKNQQSQSSLGVDSVCRRSRRELTKVRAEARRTSLNRNSSSEDDSNSSQRFRSDESLSKGFICAKKTRSARTERYLKRHSRDGENPNNYLRVSKSDDAESSFLRLSDESTRSPSVSPSQFKVSYSSVSSQSPSLLGLSTIPPSHVNHHGRFRVSNSTSNPSYKPPLSMNEYNNNNNSTARSSSMSHHFDGRVSNNQRSFSVDANIHRSQENPHVIYAKLELGKPRARNFTLVDSSQLRQYCNAVEPPAPPPRDPKRLISNQSLDTTNERVLDTSLSHLRNNRRNLNSSGLPSNFKSSSEDHIPRRSQVTLVERPASATPAPKNQPQMIVDQRGGKSENYQYLTDKQPRSRKPIFIQNGLTKSFSQREVKVKDDPWSTNKSSAFLDQLKAKKSNRENLKENPQMFTAETKVQTQIFLPSVLSNNNNGEKSEQIDSEDVINQNQEQTGSIRRKSSNLEEALKELEAIYDSLKLGDENLLEMAEQREKDLATQNLLEKKNHYPFWSSPRGTLSDSGFNYYEPFDSLDDSKRKRYFRKSLKSDDMAFRKINREERAATITDPQSVAANISYLLTSPIYAGSNQNKIEDKTDPNEPDITLDDVVYRNITQSNKLKVPEHPPPFGIPLRPIALASNSDYLHAIADTQVPKPSRMPDLVKDDLAFRNLRKDNNKAPALPPVSAEDLRNNNETISNENNKVEATNDLKKKRAVRSKSANIGSLISREVIERASRRNARDRNNENDYKTLSDIADAMEIARQVLKDKENKLTEKSLTSLSDTDSKNHLNYYPRYPRRKTVDGVNKEEFIFDVKEDPVEMREQTKEGTPDPVSAFEDGKLGPLFRTSSFEDALTALAIEAKEASDKFNEDLAAFDSGVKEEPVSLCRKLLNAVLDSTQDENGDPETVESVANIVLSSKEDSGKRSSPIIIDDIRISEETASVEELLKSFDNEKEEPDYCNLDEDKEVRKGESPGERCVDVVKCLNASRAVSECALSKSILSDSDGDSSGFFSQTSHFLEHVCSSSSDNLSRRNPESPHGSKTGLVTFFEDEPARLEEAVKDSSEDFAQNKLHSSDTLSFSKFSDSNDRLKPPYFGSREESQNSSSSNGKKLEVSENLKSPKLVLESSKLSLINNDFGNVRAMDRSDRDSRRHIPDNFKSSAGAWHSNPATLAIACCYGIACSHQLASLDLFTVMGIIFAILTFIAALFV